MADFSEVAHAVYHKDLPALQALTAVEVNLRDQDGRTPLMHSILAEGADPAVVAVLIGRGAEVDTADDGRGWTALHFAASDQNLAVARQLLEAGAAVDPVDVFGNTPLWRAVMEAGSSPAVTALLVRHGADPERKNRYGISPLDLARSIGRQDLVNLMESGEG